MPRPTDHRGALVARPSGLWFPLAEYPMATESAIAATANEGAQISWRLPFNTYSRETDGALCSGCLECLPTTRGMCMQGNQ